MSSHTPPLPRLGGASPTRGNTSHNYSHGDLQASARRHREAATLLRQLECRVSTLEMRRQRSNADAGNKRRVDERRAEVLRDRQAALATIEGHRAWEAEEKARQRSEEQQRKAASRELMGGLFQQRREAAAVRHEEWRRTAAAIRDDTDEYAEFRSRSAAEQRAAHARSRSRVVTAVERSRRAAGEERRSEAEEGRRVREEREAERRAASERLVQEQHARMQASAEARKAVEARNHAERRRVVEQLEQLHSLTFGAITRDVNRLRERERALLESM